MATVENVKDRIIFQKINYSLVEQVKRFCLAVIKESYNYDYQKDWAYDLDNLFEINDYYRENLHGAFFVATINDEVVATAAIRSLSGAPDILNSMAKYFINPQEVAMVTRVYVKKELRGQGIGEKMNNLIEEEALLHNYSMMYLNASRVPDAVSFWKKMAYQEIFTEDDVYQTTHMKKNLI